MNLTKRDSSSVRWGYAVVGIITLIFLGLIYAWSVFVTPMETEFGWARAQTSLTFTICMCMFCIGNMFAGYAVQKLRVRGVMMISAAFILIGLMLSSGVSSLIALYICYGICCGFGVGIGYNSILNSILKWFPDKTGFLSGILLMGFGFGGMILGSTAGKMISLLGWRSTLKILGIVLAVVIIIVGMILRPPTETEAVSLMTGTLNGAKVPKEYNTRDMLNTSSFYILFVWLILLSAVGLTIVGNASPLAQTMTDNLSVATFAAGLVSIFNGVGRCCVGLLLDRFGSRKIMTLYSGVGIAACLVLILAVHTGTFSILVAGYVMMGFAFSACSPTQSAYISKVYGTKYYATNFSIMNLSLLVAAFLGPYVMGHLLDLSGYQTIMFVLLAMTVANLIAGFFIRMHFQGMKQKKEKNSYDKKRTVDGSLQA